MENYVILSLSDIIMLGSIKRFIKREIVLSIAIVLTVITCFFVPVDKEYLNYFEMDTLLSLFSMLVVVTGLKKSNVFDTYFYLFDLRKKSFLFERLF